MGRIRQLDAGLVNQIAAGEVVERPAAAVKELVENSLDAGAASITVRVGDPCWVRLEVQDDGEGILAEDLPLAVARHATSKVRVADDLLACTSLGFRGEALAAIGAVARLTVRSRPPQAPAGAVLTVAYGEAGSPAPAAMGPGTRVTVEDLFGRLPARAKYLRSPSAEYAAVHQVVARYAVGHYRVRFRLLRGDPGAEREELATQGGEDPRAALLAVFGTEVADRLLPLASEAGEGDGITVSGFVLPADLHRPHRRWQGLYLNGRPVANWTLRQAVEEAFRPQVPEGRHPGFWLWVTLDPARVDPNVHPAKLEVRVDGERLVAGRLYRAVAAALAGSSPAVPLWQPVFPTSAPDPAPAVAREAPVPAVPGPVPAPPAREPAAPLREAVADLVPLAQWQAKYIIAQGPDGLYLIDQHAAHERVYYEHFRRLAREARLAQPLLLPWTVSLSPEQWAAYEALKDGLLPEWGFAVDALGGRTLAVRAIPRGWGEVRADTFTALLDAYHQGGFGPGHSWDGPDQGALAMAACKAAVKAYRGLSREEMGALLAALAATADPRSCPHGRPTMLRLTLEEVDRRFGRSS
ncbi:MAG: DNA mismatch repair endonuclease MutL [Firmicutes bacterium]|nr:DNA mismatch repair endonuclease MutL [Bacillota bacterium]